MERKRLFGLGMFDDSRARAWTSTRRRRRRAPTSACWTWRGLALHAGYPVVLDAAFLRRSEREAAHALAHELKAPFSILACAAPPAVLRDRLRARRHDASEADVVVLDRLGGSAEALAADELADVLAPAVA